MSNPFLHSIYQNKIPQPRVFWKEICFNFRLYDRNVSLSHVVVSLLSRVQLFVTPWMAARQASLSFTISQSFLKLMSTISSSLAPFSSCCQSSPGSGSTPMSCFFTSGGQSIRASALASVLPMKSGLISFSIDWFDFLAVQATLRSLLQHHDLKASVLQGLASFMVLLSHLYTTTRKTIALTMQTFVGQVMSLLFNTLSRFVIAFLPRSKRLLISWLQSLSAVILEPKKIKSVTVSIVSPSICHEVMGTDAMIFIF